MPLIVCIVTCYDRVIRQVGRHSMTQGLPYLILEYRQEWSWFLLEYLVSLKAGHAALETQGPTSITQLYLFGFVS